MARVADGEMVAVQADDLDTARRTGWSVTVVGRALSARDGVELFRLRLRSLPLQWWDPADRERPHAAVAVRRAPGRP